MSAPLKAKRSFKTWRSIMALVLREMATTNGRSPGGYLWAVLEPVGAIALLSMVFSLAFRVPSLGSNFALFYATGYLPFQMAMDLNRKISVSIRFSRPLLAYPAVTFFDAIAARFLLNFLTHIMVFYIVIFGIETAFETGAVLNFSAIFSAFSMAAALGVGIGVLNCYLMSTFTLWDRAWTVLTRPLFIISGVLFIPEVVPQFYRDYLLLNPLVHVVSEMRRGFYPTYEPAYVSYVFVYGIALVSLTLGLVFLGRYHRDILADN